MELKFSKMSVEVDTSLAKEYLNEHKALSELCNDYEQTTRRFHPYVYDGETFTQKARRVVEDENVSNTLHIMASSLKKNANLIAQLEYHFRKIPIEVTNVQLNLIIQYMKCCNVFKPHNSESFLFPNDPLINLEKQIVWLCETKEMYCACGEIAAICHLLITLLHEAHDKECCACYLEFQLKSNFKPKGYFDYPMKVVKDLDSGTVAVVSDDADVDSAVAKLISVCKQNPWRLRRILVQESVYQQFKDALSWKCNLKTSGDKPKTSDLLCSDSLTYNDITFLIDPVELVEEHPSKVTVEAYRTTKEMISLVQQDKTRYLSLWTNGIAEINEVTHATKSPVVWVNTVADFRGPAQVSEAVFAYTDINPISTFDGEGDNPTKLSQAWLKLDVESRRDILCSVLDKYILLNSADKNLPEIKKSLLTCTLKSFVDVGKDYVCIGMSQPLGITLCEETLFSVESFKTLLQGNTLLLNQSKEDFTLFEQAGVPVIQYTVGQNLNCYMWESGLDSVTRVVWTNSGTIFAN